MTICATREKLLQEVTGNAVSGYTHPVAKKYYLPITGIWDTRKRSSNGVIRACGMTAMLLRRDCGTTNVCTIYTPVPIDRMTSIRWSYGMVELRYEFCRPVPLPVILTNIDQSQSTRLRRQKSYYTGLDLAPKPTTLAICGAPSRVYLRPIYLSRATAADYAAFNDVIAVKETSDNVVWHMMLRWMFPRFFLDS